MIARWVPAREEEHCLKKEVWSPLLFVSNKHFDSIALNSSFAPCLVHIKAKAK
jgi:hypothetical protein